jgi:tripartite-type tricarboxylate transporter receptor subunit TctC
MKKNMTKKTFLVMIIMLVLSLVHLYAAGGQAQSSGGAVKYPTRPITLIVENSAGGGQDLTARAVARFSQKYLGVEMIVENRPGGSGAVANTYFNSVPLDGYTILLYGGSSTTGLPLTQKVAYNPLVDQEAIGGISNNRNVWTVRADSSIRDFDEFVKYCQANPGQKIATADLVGPGTLGVLLLNMRYNTGLIPVTYDSSGEAVLAAMGGETLAATGSIGGQKVQLNAGNVRGLAVFGATPDPSFPEFKTAIQMGYNVALNNYVGFAVRAGTDPVIRQTLEDFLLKLPNDPEFVQLMSEMGFPIDPMNGKDFQQYLTNEINTIKSIMESASIPMVSN